MITSTRILLCKEWLIHAAVSRVRTSRAAQGDERSMLRLKISGNNTYNAEVMQDKLRT